MKNLQIKQLEELIKAKAEELNLKISQGGKIADEKVFNLTMDALSPNLITSELENLIRDQIAIQINEGLGLPFENHRVLNDNGIIQIRDIAKTYQGDANINTANTNAEANKDSVRYEQKKMDLSKKANWKSANGTISPLKAYTNLKGKTEWANNEIQERINAIFWEVINYIFETIKNYEWSDEETAYTESLLLEPKEINLKRYLTIEKVLMALSAKDGIRGFNQADENHEGEETFLNKISDRSKITIIIDSQILAEIKTNRAAYLYNQGQEQNINPWNVGKIETYNFKNFGIDPTEQGQPFAFIFTPAAINYGLYQSNGQTIFGTAEQIFDTTNGHYDAVMLYQASKCKIIDGVKATPPIPQQTQKEANTEQLDINKGGK